MGLSFFLKFNQRGSSPTKIESFRHQFGRSMNSKYCIYEDEKPQSVLEFEISPQGGLLPCCWGYGYISAVNRILFGCKPPESHRFFCWVKCYFLRTNSHCNFRMPFKIVATGTPYKNAFSAIVQQDKLKQRQRRVEKSQKRELKWTLEDLWWLLMLKSLEEWHSWTNGSSRREFTVDNRNLIDNFRAHFGPY